MTNKKKEGRVGMRFMRASVSYFHRRAYPRAESRCPLAPQVLLNW
jgi:hypothetical protein